MAQQDFQLQIVLRMVVSLQAVAGVLVVFI